VISLFCVMHIDSTIQQTVEYQTIRKTLYIKESGNYNNSDQYTFKIYVVTIVWLMCVYKLDIDTGYWRWEPIRRRGQHEDFNTKFYFKNK